MRTTLSLPDGLLEEAQELLGLSSKSETVAYALADLVRRSRVNELKRLLGTVTFEYDSTELRKRDRARANQT